MMQEKIFPQDVFCNMQRYQDKGWNGQRLEPMENQSGRRIFNKKKTQYEHPFEGSNQ
jgi:hypothetical protein